MPSPTDFNLSPYFDDYDESKKFHRILFRPAFAVQARELTQSQSILQNQIERVGDHLFKQGAMVIPGNIGLDTRYTAVKLTSIGAGLTLSSFTKNTLLIGSSSGAHSVVVNSVASDGTDPNTLFVKEEKTGTNKTSATFTPGETLTGTTPEGVAVTCVVNSVSFGSACSVKKGVYYINGFFVQVEDEVLILDKYTNTPSYRVGFLLTESFVTSNEDGTLVDNAQGSSNANAPGAHRFKINLTLAKRTLTSSSDANFFEVLRVENGLIKSQVRGSEYNILEDTLARRTFDESGDYTIVTPEFDVREHLIDGNNRGIFSSANGGSESKLAIGVSPFKAYVRGYESEILSTTFVDVDKARDFDTQNNNKTRFNVKNFVNVSNVYGSPDIGFVSGDVEAFKNINLYKNPTTTRGVEVATTVVSVPQIGRAKSRGFEFVTGTESLDIINQTSIYKHYLFDIEMFEHLSLPTSASFTTGELISGATSGATGIVMSDTATTSQTITSISVANPGVVTKNNHGFTDGQQITISGGSFQVSSSPYTPGIYVVRNSTTNTFQLYQSDGTTPVNVTSYSTSPTLQHTVVVVSNVNGTFQAGEIISGSISNASGTIQSDRLGYKGNSLFDFSEVKQIGMAGTPPYTADTVLDITYGDNLILVGNVSIANSDATLLGKGSSFSTDLKIGDSITFTNNAGGTVTKRIKYIVSDTELELDSNVGGSDVTTSAIVTRRRTKIQNPDSNTLVFKLPNTTIKTLKTTTNSGSTDTNFNVRRNFTATLSSNGDAQITVGTNELFTDQADDDFVVTIMSTGAGSSAGVVGDVLNTSGNNHEGTKIFTLSGSPEGKTIILDFGANFRAHKIKILATVSRSVAGSKTKTLNTAAEVNISTQNIIESGTIGLGKADVYKINAVYMSTSFGTPATTASPNITSRFDLDNGQRDNYYDIGRLKLKPGSLKPTGALLVNFDYFSHGSGDYFDVDSYSGVIDYEDVPTYISDTTGIKYALRDCLDFRPRVDDDSTIPGSTNTTTAAPIEFERSFDGTGASTVDPVEFNSDITTDYEFYLNRIDKIFITRTAQLKVVKGASALSPLTPANLEGHLHLATLRIPSYTLNTSDVIVIKEDNRRFTMRDIGRLEKRIQNVEYYTQLSLLEADAQSLQIQDVDGFDRFKNGFIVDNFTGHNIGDVGNKDYKLAIDRGRGEARTMFNEDILELEEVDNDGSEILAADRVEAGYAKTGDLITLPYTETIAIQQPYATKLENLNPFLVFNWVGNIELDPPLDEWKETERAPELVVNIGGAYDNLVESLGLTNTAINSIPFGTEWNEWQDQWSGNPRTTTTVVGNTIVTTTSTDVIQTRGGIRTDLVPQTVTHSLGDKVVAVNFVPFVRSRDISFIARGMRPNTRVFPFFDNEAVSVYVTPTGGVLGGNLNTDDAGTVSGVFSIPSPLIDSNPRWRTGTKVFRLTSLNVNSEGSFLGSEAANFRASSAEADYVARGLQETVQGTIISTREPRVIRTTVTQTTQIVETSQSFQEIPQPPTNEGGGGDGGGGDGGGSDPLAQSFIIDTPGGVYVTSLDIFFGTKCRTLPVRAEIRNMINGYPGTTILPFAQKYLTVPEVNESGDGTEATTFTFDSPVYLREGTEYCFVLYSDSPDYQCYTSRLGEKVINSDRTVSNQPAVGVMFKSANNRTWQPEQMEDIKFTLRKAVFTTGSTGTVTVANKTLPNKTLSFNPIRTFNGTGLIRIYHPNHGMHGSNNNVTIAGLVSGTSYNGILGSLINGTYINISNITLDSYDIQTAGTANASGDVGGATVTATQNRLFDVLQLQIGALTHPETTLTSSLRTTSGRSVNGSETEFTLQGVSAAQSAVIGDNIFFREPRLVASSINQTNEMSGSRSLFYNINISTANANLSPVIDVKRLNAFAISNRLNNPLVSSTDLFTGDGSTASFTLSGTITSVHLLAVKKNGKKLQPVDNFTVAGTTITFIPAPAAGSKIVVKRTNTVNYEDDIAVEGGSSAGAYITKKVSLSNASTALDIRVAASIRATSSIKAYYRTSGSEEIRRIEDIEFTPFNLDGSPDISVDPSTGDVVLDSNFRDYKFSENGIKEFTSFQIKIVFNGTNSAFPARLKDFRAIALAI
jgi:hypothetical protein